MTRWTFIYVILLEPDQQPLHADVCQHFKDYDEKIYISEREKDDQDWIYTSFGF